MTRSVVALALLLGACGPSKPIKQAENEAFNSFVDYSLELAQLRHACDREQEATIDALNAGTEALKADLLHLYTKYTQEYERAEAAEKTCRAKLPSLSEQEQEYRKRADVWAKNCSACAAEQRCVAAQRVLRDLDEADMDAFKDNLARLKRNPACN